MKKNYGLPYKGSKNRLAEEIVNLLPLKKVLVDLFGGGGAISICASQSLKFDRIIYNELNTLIAETFLKAINGEYENERRWISHEEFDLLKDKDGYVAICFSFSNNCERYMYGPKIEPYKRAYHYAIVFDDFEPFNELFDNETTEKIKKSVEGITDFKERRLKFTKALGEYILSLERMPNLECKERMDLLRQTCYITELNARNALVNWNNYERLDTFINTNTIEVLNKDYADVELPSPEDCVIYCDIPYSNTWTYIGDNFNSEQFYKWCQDKASEGYQIYISSYELPEDLFTEVWQKKRFSKGNLTGKHVIEKIYVPKCNK